MEKIEQKFSFEQITKSIQAQKHNSDLQNLAHALEYSDAAIADYEKSIEKAKNLKKEIIALATRIESGEIVDVQEVRKLYIKSQNLSDFSL
jgi:uncharacterized iron-regulated protein